jgi:hypothetical protein
MHQFHKFIFPWKSTCFGQFLYPSSGFYSLYTQQWFMSYRFVDSFRAGPARKLSTCHVPFLSVQWINSWWWTEELSETCRVSRQNKFVKLVHLVGFIIKKFFTTHGHTNVKYPNICPKLLYLLPMVPEVCSSDTNVSATSTPGICGYISVTDTLKFIYFLIKGIMFC